MPEEGVALTPSQRLLGSEELQRLVRLFARLGVRKVRLTGGEPLVRRDLEEVIGEPTITDDRGSMFIPLQRC